MRGAFYRGFSYNAFTVNVCAVVLFVGDPRREEARKGLPPRFLAELHREQIRRLRSLETVDVLLARDTGHGFSLAGPDGSIEFAAASIGDKIDRALGHCFSLGYAKVAIMAADVAPVAAPVVGGALERATPEGAVLGRSPDGGFYIAAFAALPAIDWKTLPWHSRETADAVVTALRNGGTEVVLLDQVHDIDSAEDAERAIRAIPDSRLRSRLLSRLRSRITATPSDVTRVEFPDGLAVGLRAPPAA
ncbi:MAG TPA: DUF2064 domain-containing protein [Thermoanaerobaculia bacterium]|nr:DUF2064 domain-containing protein [Thermoanaerobaculia bacterium]